ncbi:class I SAM-dependent methyltransferase [Micromonospora sp. NPDC000089]|uniref:class I SAM-dependent methyltransferase n=1 Tax=unclassified Micromonospora TaxID=2617518 RepID=UPI0036B7C98D
MQGADFYDETYFDRPGKSHYDEYTPLTAPFDEHAEGIIDLMRGNGVEGRVLDIGCAKGYLVAALRRRGIEAYGVDWSEYAVSKADPEIRTYLTLAPAWELPFSDGWFAASASFDVLEHMDHEHAVRALRESARVSTVQLHQVNTGRVPELQYEGDDSHCLKYPIDRWREIAGDMGLTGMDLREVVAR